MYTLMIVDDEPLTRQFLKQIIPTLDSRWQIIHEAVEGSEALESLKIQSVDLVITDIKMPIMDGIELCKNIYEKYSQIHCVILSGYGDFDYAKKAIQYSVNDYLLKPIVNEELKNILKKMANLIDEENKKKHKLETLIDISNKTKEQIIRKFLKAVITESYIEINSLYPTIYDLTISLIESEGVIILLQIAESELIINNIELSKLPLLKLLLHESAIKLTKNTTCKVFFDMYENTALLIPINENENLINLCTKIFNNIDINFYRQTNLHVNAAIGTKQSDILQMNISYKNAQSAFIQYVFKNITNKRIALYDNTLTNITEKINNLLISIQLSITSKDIIKTHLLITDYINIIDDFNICTVIKFGVLIIKSIENTLNYEKELTEKAYTILKTQTSLNKLEKSYIESIYIKIANIFIEGYLNENKYSNNNHLVDYTKQYIYDHYMEPISLSLIAQKLSVSSSYLSNLFHEVEGQSYIKFLTKIRIEQAATMLKNQPNCKIKTIAENVGYISVKHFSYIFKKYYNLSPGEYRDKFIVSLSSTCSNI